MKSIPMTFEYWVARTIPLTDKELVIAKAAWEAATRAAYETCEQVCEDAADKGDGRGIERDVFIWNKATSYCVSKIGALSR